MIAALDGKGKAVAEGGEQVRRLGTQRDDRLRRAKLAADNADGPVAARTGKRRGVAVSILPPMSRSSRA